MYAAQMESSSAALNQAIGSLQTVGVAMLAGWLAERALDTGLRIPAIGPLCGLAGFYAGSWLWSWGGWSPGPVLAGFALLPALVGSFAVCAVLKLVTVGVAGPRW